MAAILNGLAAGFDWLMSPLVRVHPLLGVVVAALLTAVLVLLIYRAVSNERALRATRARIQAELLSIAMYRDSLRILFGSAGRALLWNLRYLQLNLVPLAVVALPVVLLMANLEVWFGHRPFLPGESALVTVTLAPGQDVLADGLELRGTEGVVVGAQPVRVPGLRQATWRVRATQAGEHLLRLRVAGMTVTKTFAAGERPRPLSLRRHQGVGLETLLEPGEAPLADASGVQEIGIDYPARRLHVFGWRLHWLVVYLVLTLIVVLALRRPFHVSF